MVEVIDYQVRLIRLSVCISFSKLFYMQKALAVQSTVNRHLFITTIYITLLTLSIHLQLY